MLADQVQHLIAIVAYMAVVIAIGVIFAKRANKDTESYFLGGRTSTLTVLPSAMNQKPLTSFM